MSLPLEQRKREVSLRKMSQDDAERIAERIGQKIGEETEALSKRANELLAIYGCGVKFSYHIYELEQPVEQPAKKRGRPKKAAGK